MYNVVDQRIMYRYKYMVLLLAIATLTLDKWWGVLLLRLTIYVEYTNSCEGC